MKAESRRLTAWGRPSGPPYSNVWLDDVQEDGDAIPLSTPWRSLELAGVYGAAHACHVRQSYVDELKQQVGSASRMSRLDR